MLSHLHTAIESSQNNKKKNVIFFAKYKTNDSFTNTREQQRAYTKLKANKTTTKFKIYIAISGQFK